MHFSLLNIISWLEAHQLPCPFKELTNVDCPGCGIQRSFILLIKGHFSASFLMYPALIPILLLFVLLILQIAKKLRNGHAVLKYGYIFCAGVITVSYIYKIITKTI